MTGAALTAAFSPTASSPAVAFTLPCSPQRGKCGGVVGLAGGEPELARHRAPWCGGTARCDQLCSGDGGASGVAHDDEGGDVVLVRVTVQ
jgi:hypothetical protein